MAVHEFAFNTEHDVDHNAKLGEMAVKIATQNFDLHYATLVLFNTTLWCGVEVFLRSFNYNLILNAVAIRSKTVEMHQYVVFGKDFTDIEQALDTMHEHGMDSNGKFIIICQSNKHKECDETDAMELFWGRSIVNVVWIKLQNARAIGFTYFPIAENNCHNLIPVKLDRLQCSDDKMSHCRDLYGLKLTNLYSCPLVVSSFVQAPYMNISNGVPRGADGDMLCIVAEALNSSLVVVMPHRGEGWGWRQDNGTWMGSLADLQEDLANMSMTSAALTNTRLQDFHVSNSYLTQTVGWVTHPAVLKPVGLKLLYPFKIGAQIALVGSFLLVVLCAFLLRTKLSIAICDRIHAVQPTKSVVFYAWLLCMGQAITKFPSKTALLQITLLWILYCFVIRNAYQVYLISSLKGKFYENQFMTIEDAKDAKYPFGGGPALKDLYADHPFVYDNWVNIEASEMLPLFRNISKGMKFVLAMNIDSAKYYLEQYNVSVHILPQKIVITPTSIFFKEYSPLLEPINIILGRLSASGLPNKFHQKYTTVRHVSDQSNDEEVINLDHLYACYMILIIGWSLSILFFLLEIYFGRIYKHPAKSQFT